MYGMRTGRRGLCKGSVQLCVKKKFDTCHTRTTHLLRSYGSVVIQQEIWLREADFKCRIARLWSRCDQ